MARARACAALAVVLGALAAEPAMAVDAPVPAGAALYAWHCLPCHAAGAQYPGTQALQTRYQGTLPPVLTERTDLSAELVRVVLRQGINIMPFYRRTELSDAEVGAIADYLARPR
ncbi:MAG: cytochrome c [Steroidobacteraceae bacterium]